MKRRAGITKCSTPDKVALLSALRKALSIALVSPTGKRGAEFAA